MGFTKIGLKGEKRYAACFLKKVEKRNGQVSKDYEDNNAKMILEYLVRIGNRKELLE